MQYPPPVSRVGILRDPLFLLHENDRDHLECPDRLRAIDAALSARGLSDRLAALPARDAAREELAWVHDEQWLRAAERTRGVRRSVLDPDTAANAHSFDAAVRAAGGAISCVEAAAQGALAACFALVRPPGHHAEAERAMGFCLFNNVAVAAEYALRRRGLERVLIVDWDVHHGNGTMHSFYGTDRVLFFSTHQYPHYPGTGSIQEIGTGAGLGFTVNVPLPPGQGDEDYAGIFSQVLLPLAREYSPQLILVSAGFDISRGDPLGDMQVTAGGFSRLTRMLMELSHDCCRDQLVFLLEGGYRLDTLADGVCSVIETLAGDGVHFAEAAAPERSPLPSAEAAAVIAQVRAQLSPFWKSLR
ncbi:MAG TPA: histone deacetylase [bacterium]|nr:histone deacetylase [bacterium]